MKRSVINEIVPEEKEAIATLPKNGSKNGKSKTLRRDRSHRDSD